MAGIIVQNSLKVLTQNGECQIDLCIGDITLLDHKDKVDVVVVSAFRGKIVGLLELGDGEGEILKTKDPTGMHCKYGSKTSLLIDPLKCTILAL